MSRSRLLVSRHDGCLADWGLPDRGLANRHFADWSLLIDRLSAREVGSASGSHHGKHCAHNNHNFHHGIPPKFEETKQQPVNHFPSKYFYSASVITRYRNSRTFRQISPHTS